MQRVVLISNNKMPRLIQAIRIISFALLLLVVHHLATIAGEQNEIKTEWRELSKGLFKTGGARMEANIVLERLKKLRSFVDEKLDAEVFFLMDRLKSLIEASEVSWDKCSAEDFYKRKKDVAVYLATSSNMVRYLLECERKQFDKCKGTLAVNLLDSLTNISDQDKENAILLANSVYLPSDTLPRVRSSGSLDALQTNILTSTMIPGLLEFIVTQSGKLNTNTLLIGADKVKKEFEIKWSNYIDNLCEKVMFKIEPSVRAFKNVFDDKLLASLDKLTQNWIKTVDICLAIQSIGVDKAMEQAYRTALSS